MPDNSVDAIVTDPPYGLSFMNKEWDSYGTDTRQPGDEHYVTPDNPFGRSKARYGYGSRVQKSMAAFQLAMTPIFKEALRVAKPGAHLLCFGGTRTFHRMACAIEDAGWEIRDCIMWVYGSGFPKSMDVAKAIDKSTGYVGEVIGERTVDVGMQGGHMHAGRKSQQQQQVRALSDQAKEWDGWGTCLKPAWEPIIVARKPLDGTVAHNVLTWGVGALNIDACRVGIEQRTYKGMSAKQPKQAGVFRDDNWVPKDIEVTVTGRFPANLVHDGSQMVLDLFPDSKGQQARVAGNEPSRTGDNGIYGHYGQRNEFVPRGDSCSAARFFYCAKASKKERGEGNNHPTVKPIALMKWLVTLVTPEGGVVLDPFAGSGTTLVACRELDRDCIGIEREPEYVEIIKKRLGAA
jgi:site-specific DNA-methyltransferase (adenine-specific)